MGRLQRFAVKARSARGAVALGGAAVLAVGLAQASGTLAQSDAVRTATLPLASANYFPTPLPATELRCSTGGASTRVDFSWDAPALPGNYQYMITVFNGDNQSVKEGPKYQAERTYRVSWDYNGGGTYHAEVRVVNLDGGTPRIVSSGYLRHAFYHNNLNWNWCTGDPWRQDNQPWENQKAWTPGTMFRTAAPQGGLVSLLSEMEPEVEAAALASEPELTTLEDAAKEAPATTQASTPSSSTAAQASETPSKETNSTEASTSSEESSIAGTTGEAATTSTSVERPSTSVPTSTPRSTMTRTSTPSSMPRSTQTSTSVETSTSASATWATTSAAPVRRSAGVGDDPIAVGTSFAQLDELGGDTQVTVFSGGAEVCTVPVPGATRIETAGGTLEVTIAGETYRVDTSTCEVS